MSDNKKGLNEGYQPQKNNVYQPRNQRGYQPKPNGNFGFQPTNQVPVPPPPPTSGSNIIKSEKSDN